ncbi:hypothetical protein A3A21_01885 [Candidatus Jorgensenbacteria bacterium RIFCSPLOWO2_01_FULL_45_25b]|uniref:Uncharacterized protein n=1 Tax=Candidatus Jorgensenbacteria bacterium RIFCSPLOWO2_01_FULL_45_25b TaxID=1798471 RepID=A0A1F6BVC7_9BACT|nr:MAG: hypothetical protein A3A21_01885 [Candidatus Jorgensenbacteria bacterium RIFCSPLOWO2_01_FULL_45_25b]
MKNRIKELFFQNKSSRQTVAKNIFWLSFSQFGGRLIRSSLIIYAARLLGASEYGLFSYVLGLSGFFMTFVDIGINPLLTREVAKYPEKQYSYFSVSLFLKIILLISTSLLIFFVAPHFSKIEGAASLIPFIALLVIFDGVREFSIAFFRAKEKMELEALVSMFTNISITVFGFLILQRSATAYDLTVTYILSAGTGAIAAIILLRKEFHKVFSSFQKRLLKPLIADALPIALVSVIGMFMLNVDIIMLGWLKTASDVGFYSSGQRIVQLLYTIPAILASSIFPALSRFVGEKNTEAVRALVEQALTATFMISLPLTIGGLVLARPIISFLYGVSYIPATLSFQILLGTLLLQFSWYFIGNLLFVYNKSLQFSKYLILGSLSNIGFNLLLIPHFGAAGAALATVFSQILYILLSWRMIKRDVYFLTLRYLPRIVFSSFLMGGFVFFLSILHLHVLLIIFIAALFYFFLLYLQKEKALLHVFGLFKRV